MSTVALSSSQTISSPEYKSDEERRCGDGGDFAGFEYLTSKASQGSIDVDSEIEASVSGDGECVVDKICASFTFTVDAAENQAQEKMQRQPQQHASLAWEDPAISETSWTDEKHSLYLNSIEDAFVQSLYKRDQYLYSCKRWKSESITTSVSGKGLYEAVQPRISCDYQPLNLFPDEKGIKAQMRCKGEEIQNPTERFRLDRKWIKQGHQEANINGGVNNWKSLKEPTGEGSAETADVPSEYTPKIQMQRFKYAYKRDRGRNQKIWELHTQEDQIVPSMENTSQNSE